MNEERWGCAATVANGAVGVMARPTSAAIEGAFAAIGLSPTPASAFDAFTGLLRATKVGVHVSGVCSTFCSGGSNSQYSVYCVVCTTRREYVGREGGVGEDRLAGVALLEQLVGVEAADRSVVDVAAAATSRSSSSRSASSAADNAVDAVGTTREARQRRFTQVVICNQATDTEQTACFREAACVGLTSTSGTCTIAGVSTSCPPCNRGNVPTVPRAPYVDDGESKKGLLGLLALIGLIPLAVVVLLLVLVVAVAMMTRSERPKFDEPFGGRPPVPYPPAASLGGPMGPAILF